MRKQKESIMSNMKYNSPSSNRFLPEYPFQSDFTCDKKNDFSSDFDDSSVASTSISGSSGKSVEWNINYDDAISNSQIQVDNTSIESRRGQVIKGLKKSHYRETRRCQWFS